MAKMFSNGNPYENLANAVVVTAVEDYRKVLKKYSRNPDSRSAKEAVDFLERFFRSQWYSVLTSVEGEFLMRKIRAEYNLRQSE